MKTVKTGEQLLADCLKHGCKGATVANTLKLMGCAARLHRYTEYQCGTGEPNQEAQSRSADIQRPKLEKQIEALVKEIGAKGVKFSDDPRGVTVRLVMPDGECNDFAREGWDCAD